MGRKAPPNLTRDVALDAIDEPSLPMRQSMDPQAMQELMESIAVDGLLQPIVLKPRGDRFEIIAGHRRFIAHKNLALPTIAALIRDVDDDRIERFKTAENTDREDVNPADQAAYFAELFVVRCNQDVDVLCELVGRKRAYVEQRLLLHAGDPAIRQAVADGEISLSIATELNKIASPDGRAMYLDAARKGGASVRSVRTWVAQAKQFDDLQAGAAPPPADYVAPPAQPYGSSLTCIVCETNDAPYEMVLVYIHRTCKRIVLDRLLASLGPSSPASSETPGGGS